MVDSESTRFTENIAGFITNSCNEYKICAIIVLDNGSKLKEFVKYDTFKNSKLLFYSPKIDELGEIYTNGFTNKIRKNKRKKTSSGHTASFFAIVVVRC